MNSSSQQPDKPPRLIFDGIFAFPPNRDTLGGTAYLMIGSVTPPVTPELSKTPENLLPENILIDCPAWNSVSQEFLQQQGGVRWLFLTHRGAIAKAREIQQAFGCEIVIQEQEAYLLPGLTVTSFQQELVLNPQTQAIWTAGHSPGSACLYSTTHGGILFTGRHLLPNAQGEPVPLRIAKTFHWPRQIQSLQRLRDRFTPQTLSYICPGANTGFLRGKGAIDRAYERLTQLDIDLLLRSQPLL
jgi:glyoxylase-like metal-dependent hydrolase (beta-lactamase superfamily II)